MTEDRRHDLSNLAVGLALGFLGNLLLRDAAWGINLTVWMLAITGAVVLLRREGAFPPLGGTVWLAAAYSLLFGVRDSPVLHGLLLATIGAAVAFAAAEGLRRSPTLLDYSGALVDALASLMPLLTRCVPAGAVALRRQDALRSPVAERVVRGLLLSIVPVVLFGWLMVSADAIFERLVIDVFDVDAGNLAQASAHTIGWGIVACLVVYLLTGGMLAHVPQPEVHAPRVFGTVEINVVLTMVNLVFVVFVAIQAGYLFGDQTLVEAENGLTYSDYARRGFFELCAVAVMSFVMLTVFRAFMPEASGRGRAVFGILGVMHIVFVAVVIVSGLHRMLLYIGEYSLTELRFYTCAAMVWTAVQFLGLMLVMPSVNRTFVPWLMTRSAFAAVLVLFVANPDAQIARVNLDRDMATTSLDVEYLASLSADAVPTLIGRVESLPPADRAALHEALVTHPLLSESPGFREFNISRHRALRALRAFD